MKKLYSILVMIFFCLQFFALVSFGQSSPESLKIDDQKIKESFLKVINDELKALIEWAQSEKNDPKKNLRYSVAGKNWITFYDEYDSVYKYDIQKTNSIVSPYIGGVTFSGHTYMKQGVTEEECLKKEWELLNYKGRDVSSKHPKLIYSYQDGKWILKEKPSLYKKH